MTQFGICIIASLAVHLTRCWFELRIVLSILHHEDQGLGTAFWLHHLNEMLLRPLFWTAVIGTSGLMLLLFEGLRRMTRSTSGRSPGTTGARAELERDHD